MADNYFTLYRTEFTARSSNLQKTIQHLFNLFKRKQHCIKGIAALSNRPSRHQPITQAFWGPATTDQNNNDSWPLPYIQT